MVETPAMDAPLVKTFLLSKRWWQAGIANILLDDLYSCQEVFWLEDLHHPDDRGESISIVDLVEMAGNGDILTPYQGVTASKGGKTFEVALADLVTYPGMVWLQKEPLDDYAPWEQLLETNYEILAPYLRTLGSYYGLLTTVHINFHSDNGSEYAPCHNLINCNRESLDMFDDLSMFLQQAPNTFPVAGPHPIMDDRHAYLERCQGEPRRLPPYRFKTIFSDPVP